MWIITETEKSFCRSRSAANWMWLLTFIILFFLLEAGHSPVNNTSFTTQTPHPSQHFHDTKKQFMDPSPYRLVLKSCLFPSFVSVFYAVCVSQWTVAGAAGPSGVLAVEHVMLVWEGGIVQERILPQLPEVVPAKETELGLIPAALNPALVSNCLVSLNTESMFWNLKNESPLFILLLHAFKEIHRSRYKGR